MYVYWPCLVATGGKKRTVGWGSPGIGLLIYDFRTKGQVAKLDIASIAGFLMGVVMFVYGVSSGDEGMAALGNMYDYSSVLITIGGSLAGVLASHKLPDFIAGLKSFSLFFKDEKSDVGEVIKNIIDLSNIARKEGLLALEEAANGIEDEFLKKRRYAGRRRYGSGTGSRNS